MKKTKRKSNVQVLSLALVFLIIVTTLVLGGILKYYFAGSMESVPTEEQMEKAQIAAALPTCICIGLDAIWAGILIKVRGIITVFNRRELICTFDMAKQANIRKLLADHGINYRVRLAGISAGAGQGGYDAARLRKPEYIICVHKKDFERAFYLIKRRTGD